MSKLNILSGLSSISKYDDSSRYVRLTWVDFANNIRCRILSAAHFDSLVSSGRPGIRVPKVVFGLVGLRIAEGFSAVGSWLFVADMDSMRIFPGEDRVATVFGWFQHIEPSPGRDIASPLCPRSILHRVLRFAREHAGIEFLVGFETEVTLLASTKPITPIHDRGWCDARAVSSGSGGAIAREIADCLQSAGIVLEMYHAEAAPGQYEFVTGPLPPLESADALISTREIIAATASLNRMRATLSPRVFTDVCGNAAHAHISVKPVKPVTSKPTKDNKKGQDRKPPASPDQKKLETSFLASLLDHLPAIQALTQPLPASYLRVQDGIWSGGTYVAWGTYNKEAPVCLVDPHLPESRRFEIKCIDGLANPYLALAGIIAAGTKGVLDQVDLTIKDLSTQAAAEISPEERTALGIKHRMSLTVEEARQRFRDDAVLRDLLGEEFVDAYMKVNQTVMDWIGGDPESDDARKFYVEHW